MRLEAPPLAPDLVRLLAPSLRERLLEAPTAARVIETVLMEHYRQTGSRPPSRTPRSSRTRAGALGPRPGAPVLGRGSARGRPGHLVRRRPVPPHLPLGRGADLRGLGPHHRSQRAAARGQAHPPRASPRSGRAARPGGSGSRARALGHRPRGGAPTPAGAAAARPPRGTGGGRPLTAGSRGAPPGGARGASTGPRRAVPGRGPLEHEYDPVPCPAASRPEAGRPARGPGGARGGPRERASSLRAVERGTMGSCLGSPSTC